MSESDTRTSGQEGSSLTFGRISVSPYLPFWRAHRDFFASLDAFTRQAGHALVLNTAIGRRAPDVGVDAVKARARELGIDEGLARLSLFNLVQAADRLLPLKSRTRALVGSGLSGRLTALEARERTTYDAACIAWRYLLEHPERHIEDVVSTGRQERDRRLRRMRSFIENALCAAAPEARWTLHMPLVEYEDRNALLVTGDWTSALASLANIEPAVLAMAAALAAAEEHDRQATVATVPTVLVMTLVRGRPLASEAVALNAQLLADPGYRPKWYGLVPRALDPRFLEDSGIVPWDDPLVLLADPLLTSVVTTWAYIEHLSDLRIEHDLDALGTEIAQTHVGRISRSLQAAFSRLLDHSLHISEMLRARGADPELADNLLASVDALGRALTKGVALRDLPTLKEVLERAIFEVTVARSTWIDIALKEVTRQGAGPHRG